MNLLRCLLFLALIVAATATISARLKLKSRGRCGRVCGLTKRDYVRPSRGKCFNVFGFLAKAVDAKLSLAKNIFNSCSNVEVASDLNTAVGTCLNLSKGVGVFLNKLVDGFGDMYEDLVIVITRLIFCVLKNPWENGKFIDRWFTKKRSSAPEICGKEFGAKWGWKKYLRGYSSRDELVEYYNLKSPTARITSLLKLKGISRSALKGTRKVIVDTVYKLCSLLERKFSVWDRKDFVILTRYLIIMSAAVGSGYKVGTGSAVVNEYTEYLSSCYKKEFNVEIKTEETIIYKEIEECDTEEFKGAFIVDSDIDSDSSGSNSSSGGGSDKGTTTFEKTEWETVYDADGKVVSTTKPEDEEE